MDFNSCAHMSGFPRPAKNTASYGMGKQNSYYMYFDQMFYICNF